MTHGRPAMVSSSWAVELPAMIDDEYLLEVGEGSQPPDAPSQMSLFMYSTRLFGILDEILSKFYHHPTRLFLDDTGGVDSQFPETLTEVLRLEADLNRCNNEIPDFLNVSTLPESQSRPWHNQVVMQSSILRGRYLPFVSPT